ncbi:MAG TPA: hypothetical protein VIU61_18085 [Kofleriaceae bacterium]
MTSSLRTVVVLLLVSGLGGCEKPSEENCRKALANVRTLYKTDTADQQMDNAGDVRRCVGGSSKKAVDCAMNAKSLTELEACNFGKNK